MSRKVLFLSVLVLLSLFLPAASSAQLWSGIISPSRAVDWSNAGIPGGIPVRTTVCATLNPGATASQINSAISACPSGQVVYLNAGTYNLSGAIDFGQKSNITVRGAGPDKTIINFSSGSGCTYGQYADVCIQGSFSWTLGPQHSTTWTGGYAKGATQVTLGSTAGLAVGQMLILDQENDIADTGGVFVCDSTNGTGNVECSSEAGAPGRKTNGKDRTQQQVVEVTGISGNTVTISPGLYMPNWRASQNPGAWWANTTVTMDGIENMTLNHTNSANLVSGTFFFNAYKCWMQNVKSIYGHRNHVWMVQAGRIVVRDSYFYGTYNAQNLSYGVEPWMTSDLLIQNNIFQHITSPVLLGNSQGSVMAYNYMTDEYSTNAAWLFPAIMAHDGGTSMNLIEGNQAPSAMEDAIHGTHNFDTMFRNYYSGRDKSQTSQTAPIILMAYSRYSNLIGNVLGTPGYHSSYQTNVGTTGGSCDLSIYNMGWSTSGCKQGAADGSPAIVGLTIPNDPLTASTSFRWGNYDTVSNAARFVTSEVPTGLSQYANPVPASQALPASLYLSSKPSWWGSVSWPAIGPDVTGGTGPGGHAYAIPAQLCYTKSAKDANGILTFNADSCYAASAQPPTVVPPTSIKVVTN